VTFSTDIFHPLITPLTTYMYTTDIQDNGTVSATDEERLPPGGFSLRHGFPHWFGRASRSRQTSSQHPHPHPHRDGAVTPPPRSTPGPGGTPASIAASSSSPAGSLAATPGGTASFAQTRRRVGDVSAHEVLRYVAGSFSDDAVLDAVPLEAAGNPGAWHAWRTRQRRRGGAPTVDVRGEIRKFEGGGGATPAPAGPVRRPGEWSWDGVWEERVKKGIAGSLSEAVLFGGAGGGDDVVSLLTLAIRGFHGGLLPASLLTLGRFRSTSSTWTRMRLKA